MGNSESQTHKPKIVNESLYIYCLGFATILEFEMIEIAWLTND